MENAHCPCGSVSYEVVGKPLVRVFCHCTICQRLNNAPYADITLFRASDVILPQEKDLEYHAEMFPPILQRGKCLTCNGIAVETINLFPVPKMIVVPSGNLDDQSMVPNASLHIFYDTRVKDIDDDLPKYSGYLKSQLAFSRKLLGAMLF